MSNAYSWGNDEEEEPEWTKRNTRSIHQNNHNSSHGQNLQKITPQTYISLAREGMGMIETYKFDRNNSQIASKYAAEMASKLLSKMKESAEHQMMLNLDIEKKHRLKAYQEEIYHIDRAIEKATKEAENQVREYLYEHIISMKQAKKSYSDRFQSMVNNGELFQEDADELNALVGYVDNTVSKNAVNRLKLILESYGTSYERTVSLLTSQR